MSEGMARARDIPDRVALIVANGEFEDPKLNRLVKPSVDAEALGKVLGDPEIGGFEVITLVDETAQVLRRQIARLYNGRKRRDLLVLYYSGHGVRDEQSGELYLATKDTETDIPSATAIEASYVQRLLDKSDSQRKVVILDCCYAGAFARGAKAATGGPAGAQDAFAGSGYGRVILTASNALQYAWEGDRLLGEARPSVFTHFLVEGLRTGEADRDSDGKISLDELYDYVHERVVMSGKSRQTPQKWEQKVEGQMTIAKNPHPVIEPAELPNELQESIADFRAWVREGAVSQLARLAHEKDRALALAAFQALQRMTGDDSQRVNSLVTKTLGEISEVQGPMEAGVEGLPAAPEHKEVEEVQPTRAEESPLSGQKEVLEEQRAEPAQAAVPPAESPELGKEEAAPARPLAVPERKSPERAEVEDRRGRELVDEGDYEKALPFFARAIDLDPQAEYYFHRGWCYLSVADFGRGIEDLDRAIELDEDNAEYYCGRGTAHHWKDDLDMATADLSRAIELDPSDSDFRYRRGVVYEDMGEYVRAISDLSRAIELDPDPEYYFRRGLAKKAMGDARAARADLSHAAEEGHQGAATRLKDL